MDSRRRIHQTSSYEGSESLKLSNLGGTRKERITMNQEPEFNPEHLQARDSLGKTVELDADKPKQAGCRRLSSGHVLHNNAASLAENGPE